MWARATDEARTALELARARAERVRVERERAERSRAARERQRVNERDQAASMDRLLSLNRMAEFFLTERDLRGALLTPSESSPGPPPEPPQPLQPPQPLE